MALNETAVAIETLTITVLFIHTYVPMSPSSITWYQPMGGDAVRLRR